ncbi:MAG: hypothetical protein ABI333_22435 [bacterium]
MSTKWSTRRAKSLTEIVAQFLRGLESHPRLRQRLVVHGYTEQVHRELQACLAQVGETVVRADRIREPEDRDAWGTARAVATWAVEQLTVAGAAATKLPRVAQEAAAAVRASRRSPLEAFRESRKLVERVRADEHLSHFFTVGGIRDASQDLRQRLQEGGAAAPRAQRRQIRSELAFLFARWRQVCLQEFQGDADALATLGIE